MASFVFIVLLLSASLIAGWVLHDIWFGRNLRQWQNRWSVESQRREQQLASAMSAAADADAAHHELGVETNLIRDDLQTARRRIEGLEKTLSDREKQLEKAESAQELATNNERVAREQIAELAEQLASANERSEKLEQRGLELSPLLEDLRSRDEELRRLRLELFRMREAQIAERDETGDRADGPVSRLKPPARGRKRPSSWSESSDAS